MAGSHGFHDPAIAAAHAQALIEQEIGYILDDSIDTYIELLSTKAIYQTILNGQRITSRQLEELARILKKGVDPQAVADANRQLAAGARKATLISFTRQRNRNRSVRGYRSNAGGKYKRYAGGRMDRVLRSKEFWRANSKGISINLSMLGREAKQWARLNFGAGSGGRGSRGPMRVMIGRMHAATLGFDEPARPAMRMPEGFFVDAAGRPSDSGKRIRPGQFVPVAWSGARAFMDGKGNTIKTQAPRWGNYAGEQFLDAGLTWLANPETGFGVVYQNLYRDLYRRGKARSAAQGGARNYRLPVDVRR